MATFSKVMVVVELNGKAYGVDLLAAGSEAVMKAAASKCSGGVLVLNPMPNQKIFQDAFVKKGCAA